MKKQINLCFSYRAAYDCKVSGHAQKIMEDLGIEYESCEPMSLNDSFYFFNCKNFPDELPLFLTETKYKGVGQ